MAEAIIGLLGLLALLTVGIIWGVRTAGTEPADAPPSQLDRWDKRT